jgi:hypothetical protein
MHAGVLECHPAAMARTVAIVDDHDGFRALARPMLVRPSLLIGSSCALTASSFIHVRL